MTTVAATRRPFQPVRGLLWLGGYAAFGLTLSGLYAATGLGVGCPFRELTGWDCPFCGGTRLGASLLHGDLVSAFTFNPLVFVGLVVASVLGVAWVVEAAGGPRLRPPAPWGDRLTRVSPTSWLIVASVATVVYVVIRNLL